MLNEKPRVSISEPPRTPQSRRDSLEIGGVGITTPVKYDLVIMDFHGTITDHQLRTIRAYHHGAHVGLGIHLPKDFYHAALTRPAQHDKKNGVNDTQEATTNKEFIEQNFLDKFGKEAVRRMVEEFTIQMRQTYIPIPGALKTIRTLREEGVNVAILTNGDNRESVQQQLSRWRFPDLADSLYSHHVTGFKKPDPQAVECILDDYSRAGQDFPKDRIVLVGDYAQDVETAHNLGTDSVLVMRGPGWEKIKIRDPRPTYVVSEVSALLAVINGTLPPLSSSEVYVPPVFWKGEDWCPVAKKQTEVK